MSDAQLAPGGMGSAHAPLRFRCPSDDGSGKHYAFDVRMPAQLGNRSALAMLAKCQRCGCGAAMATLGASQPEPMASHPGRTAVPLAALRSERVGFRVRCEHDDGSVAHMAVNIEAPVSIGAASPLIVLIRVKCGCGGAVLVLDGAAEEPMARNAREAARAR